MRSDQGDILTLMHCKENAGYQYKPAKVKRRQSPGRELWRKTNATRVEITGVQRLPFEMQHCLEGIRKSQCAVIINRWR